MAKLKVQRDRGGPGSERRVQDRKGKGKGKEAASCLVQEAKRTVAMAGLCAGPVRSIESLWQN